MSKRRALVWSVVAVLAVLAVIAPPLPARAETYSGHAGEKCDTSDFIAFTVTLDGTFKSARLTQAKVVADASVVVIGYWRLTTSSGAVVPATKYWVGPGTFFLPDGPNQSYWATILLQQGTTGRLDFVFRKPASYSGGCFTVSNVGIELLRFGSGSGGATPPPGGGGIATPPPGAPTPTPSPTQPPSPSPSATPQPGWCVDPDYDPANPGTGAFVPCTSAPPAAVACGYWYVVTLTDATGTGGVPWRYYRNDLCATSFSRTLAEHATPVLLTTIGAAPADLPEWSGYTVGGGGLRTWHGQLGTGRANGAPGNAHALFYKDGSYAGLATAYYTDPGTWSFTNNTVLNGGTITLWGDCDNNACSGSFPAGGIDSGGLTLWYGPSFNASRMPWQASSSAEPTPTPSATPSPTLPGSFQPSLPPNPYGGGGLNEATGFDVCDPQWSASQLALCASNPTYTFAPAVPDPDGFEALASQLQNKAPFGYGYQAATALGDAAASAAGPGLESCYTFAGPPDIHFCLPLQEVSDALGPWRSVFLAMWLIVVAFGFVRLAMRAAGAGGGGGGDD